MLRMIRTHMRKDRGQGGVFADSLVESLGKAFERWKATQPLVETRHARIHRAIRRNTTRIRDVNSKARHLAALLRSGITLEWPPELPPEALRRTALREAIPYWLAVLWEVCCTEKVVEQRQQSAEVLI